MLRSTKGYFLLELLLSLSALLLICLYLLPLIIEIKEQSQRLELENKAQQIMFEELQTQLINKDMNSSYTTIQNKVEYKVNWKNTRVDQKEVCVRVEKNSYLPEIEMCGILE
jgi:competence protein ComGE